MKHYIFDQSISMVMFKWHDLGSSFEQGALNKIIMRDRAAHSLSMSAPASSCFWRASRSEEYYRQSKLLLQKISDPALKSFVTSVSDASLEPNAGTLT
jgi:hypothetical protein